MAERRMTEVVRQRQRLGEILIEEEAIQGRIEVLLTATERGRDVVIAAPVP